MHCGFSPCFVYPGARSCSDSTTVASPLLANCNAFMHFLPRALLSYALPRDWYRNRYWAVSRSLSLPLSPFPFPAISISGVCRNAIPAEGNANELRGCDVPQGANSALCVKGNGVCLSKVGTAASSVSSPHERRLGNGWLNCPGIVLHHKLGR